MEGITYEEALAAYGHGYEDAEQEFWRVFAEAKPEAERYAEQGLLIMDDRGLRLTEAGIDISNGIMSLFV
jgi:oxygen-independent coproporphyrinogen-3 oxidase